MQSGGCEKQTPDPCKVATFTGATFKFLAAERSQGGRFDVFPGTALKDFGESKSLLGIPQETAKL